MFARQSVAIGIPSGFLAVFIGIAFGFVIGLFYYQAYRKPYYWWYSIISGIAGASIAPTLLHLILQMDPNTLHATIAQFAAALIASVFTNHLLYVLKKRHKSRTKTSRRRTTYPQDLSGVPVHRPNQHAA